MIPPTFARFLLLVLAGTFLVIVAQLLPAPYGGRFGPLDVAGHLATVAGMLG